jgi:hypothetical protein
MLIEVRITQVLNNKTEQVPAELFDPKYFFE